MGEPSSTLAGRFDKRKGGLSINRVASTLAGRRPPASGHPPACLLVHSPVEASPRLACGPAGQPAGTGEWPGYEVGHRRDNN